jgi:hypothetical protein
MAEFVYAGLTSQSIDVFLQDSSSTTGGGLSGLVYNTAGLKAYYRKGATGSATAITLATQTVGGAYSSGGFVEIDATNMKGTYRLDLPNAMVDTEGFVTLYIYGATNLVPTVLRIDCRPLPVDVKKAAGTAWGSGAITAASIAASALNGKGDWNVGKTGYSLTQSFPTNFASMAITAGGAVTAGTVSDKTGYSLTQAFPSNFSAMSITVGGVIKADLDTIKTQTVTCAGGVTIPAATLASTTNITGGTITTVTNLTNAPTSGDFTTTMKTSLNAATPASVTGAVGSVTGNVGGNVVGSVASVTARVTANVDQINSTSIAGTGSQVATAFVTMFNVATPVLTVGSVNQTGDSYARIGLNGAGLTALGDTRLANLDAAVSTRSSHTAADVWAVTGRTLSSFSFEVTLAASQPNYAPSKAGDAMTLTPSERTATANEVEAQIIDDTDSEKVLTAITDKIAAANPSLAGLTLSAIAAAVRDVANTSPAANSLGAAVKASADRMPGSGTLATTADVPTVSAITTQITTDHGIGSYERNTEPVDVSTNVAAIKARTDNLPSDPADASDVAAAFSTVNSTLATIAGYIDTEIAAIKAKTDNLPPSPAAVGSAMTLADDAITSAKIADGAITSAKFTVSAITGVASGILEKIDQIWRRFFKQVTKSSTQIKTYADDGTTVLTTQSATESGSDQTLGEAS